MYRRTVALLSLVMVAAPAAAAGLPADDPAIRIFVHSDDLALRERLGVRHDFGAFFSTNVPTSVYDLLRAEGVPVEPVPWHRIQVVVNDEYLGLGEPQPECHRPNHGCGGGGGRAVPEDTTPYGIQQIYNNNGITSTSGGAGIKLGHLDTGIDTDHVDLVRRIVKCASTAGGNCEDGNGHGTHTAGTAAADGASDGLGIWGVAPEASLYTYRVCNNGGLCGVDDTIEAIDNCIADGCNVITFSIGGNAGSESERDAIIRFNNAGGLFIAANGNDGPDACTIDYPGAFKEVLGIAAINSNKQVVDFSSRGCSSDANTYDEDGETDFAAAGSSVESTYKGGGYKKLSGTSMATPHVAGLAVKKWAGSRSGTLTALENGVEDITQTTGGGGAGNGVDIASGRGLPHV